MGARILLIDDDQEFVESIQLILKSAGYDVFTAMDGETGFNAAVCEKPDLIILDVMMKTITEGIRVARQLHHDERTQGIPVLMFSALREVMKLDEDLEPDEINLPVCKFLEKPVPAQKLLSVIQEIIEKAKIS